MKELESCLAGDDFGSSVGTIDGGEDEKGIEGVRGSCEPIETSCESVVGVT